MPVVPDYTTGTLVVRYDGPRGIHKMVFYQRNGATITQTVNGARAVITAMANLQYAGTIWDSAMWYAAGQNFSTAIEWDPIESPGTGPAPGADDPTAKVLSFVGRSSTTGVRKRFFLYNSSFEWEQDLRRSSGESTGVAGVITALNSSLNLISAKDGTPALFSFYANQGLNDYWVRRDRSGG